MGTLTRIASKIERVFDPTARSVDRFEREYSGSVATPLPIDIKAAASGGMQTIIPQMYQAWGAYGYLPSITWYQLANMYVSWEYAAINKKATTLASLPVQLFRYEKKGTGKTIKPHQIKSSLYSCGGYFSAEEKEFKVLNDLGVKKVRIDEHPVLDLINNPNPCFVRSNFFQLAYTHLFLSGALGLYKTKYFLGNPTELHIVPTTWTGNFKPIPGNGRTAIAGYKLIDLDVQEDFSVDEIIWPHFPSLRNPYEGMSPIKANLYGFDLDQYMLQQLTAFYKNGAMFSNVLSTDQVLAQNVYDDLKRNFANYNGAKNAGQTFVAHGGLKFSNPMQATARDSMVDEIYKMSREKILAGEDVSAGKLGLTEEQNRANLEVVNENYFNEAIKPAAMMLMEYFDRDLVAGYDDRLSLEFVYPSFDDRTQKLEENKWRLSSGESTINEIRIENGKPPVPWGDVPLLSSTMMPLGDRPDPEPPVAPTGPASGKKPEKEDEEDDKVLRGIHNKAFWTAERKALAWKRFDRLAKAYEPLFVRASMDFFKEMQKAILDNLEAQGFKMKAELSGRSRQHKLEYIAERKDRFDALIPDKITMQKSLKRLFGPIYERTMAGAAGDRVDQLQMDLEFNVNDPRVKEWLGTRLEKFSANVSETTIQKTKDILREDFANGEGVVNMADHLKEYFTGNEARAHTIARTESVAAYNHGDVEAVKQLGVELKKVWLAEPTARETHAKAGDKYSEGGEPGPIDIDGWFEVGTDRMQAPGGGQEAGENVNCRCSLVYVRPE